LNPDILTISSGMSRAQGSGASFAPPGGFESEGRTTTTQKTTTSVKNLTSKDVVALKTVTNVKVVTGVISGRVSNVTFLGKTATINIEGVDPAVWKDIDTAEVASGRLLTQGDTNSIVVGSRVANSTFGNMGINQQILIGGQNFKIVGILKEVGSSGMGGGSSSDNMVFMPIKYATNVIENKQENTYDSILVKINDISLTNDTITAMNERLMFSHSILDENKIDFSISSPTSMQSTISSTISSASLFLTAIAVISLIVGAIGIMNTMFTSVLEKTKEIGILKAIGAKNSDILTIFLLNAAIIGLIGGVFGIALGIFSSNYVSLLCGSTATTTRGGPGGMGGMSMFLSSSYISPQLVIGIFLLSIAIGLVAGAIPAYRASRLEPVDALRYE
jgi:putative ABC transport system permease protein